MKIAISIYNGNVSNVFDFAPRLMVFEFEGGKEIDRFAILLDRQFLPQRVGELAKHGIDVLICGAISRRLAGMVVASGVELLPYVTGRVDDVLRAYLVGQLVQPQFRMSGCWSGARKGFGYRRRGCRW